MSNTPPAAGETGDRTGRYVRHPNGHVAPMSPFTDIWRWHMTMVASILFRVTIGAASVALVLLLGWVAVWALLSRFHPDRQFWHDAWAGTRLVSAPLPAKAK